MTEELRIEYVPLADVRRWSRNPKKHDIGAIVESIKRYGFIDPPKFDETLGALIYGNGRDEALEWMQAQGEKPPRGVRTDASGRWLIPVKFGVDAASVAEAEAAAIDHNNLALSGGDFTGFDMARMWDGSLTDILESLARSDALPITMDGDVLDALLAPVDIGGAGEEPAEQPDFDQPTEVQPGDIWSIGRHTVACLDSTEPANLDRVLAGRKVRFVWSDAPYGINAVANSPRMQELGYTQIANDATTETARASVALCLAQFEDAVQVWWGGNYFADALPPARGWIVWDKDHHGMDFADAELAWCNADEPVRCFRHAWSGADRDSEKGEKRTHPNQKPIELARWCFSRYGSAGDLIFDPFLGSGPSLKAAERSDRTVIGMELSPHYCDHILTWGRAAGLPCGKHEG